jgi:two-component system sensor histidine kinase UhpB
VQSFSSLPLYWRVCLINGAVFFAVAIVLVVSPATMSAEVSELAVLAFGLVLIMALNSLQPGSSGPVDRADAAG